MLMILAAAVPAVVLILLAWYLRPATPEPEPQGKNACVKRMLAKNAAAGKP